MTEPKEPAAGVGAENAPDAPDLNVNGGDPLPDDPEDAPPEKPARRPTRTNLPPDARRGR